MNSSTLPEGFHFFERGWLSSNSLLIHRHDHAVVFDTGYTTHAPQLLHLLESQLKGQPLDLIVNSHLHSDHCGGNALLQASYPQVDIQIPAQQFDYVLNWDDDLLTYEATGQRCAQFKPTLPLSSGDLINTGPYVWQVFTAPGHDNDECIFFLPDFNILFSADALWKNGLGVVFPEFLGGIGFENVSKTLDLIVSLKPSLVLPGHGSYFSNFAAAVSNARYKLDMFSNSPDSHALYSAKVLLKFKLLEIQKITVIEFIDWGMRIRMLDLIHKRFFSKTLKMEWIKNLLQELIARGAAAIDSDWLYNL